MSLKGFHVFPRFPLPIGAPEEKGRVKGGHDGYPLPIAKSPSEGCDARFCVEKRPSCWTPESTDDLGSNDSELPREKRIARGDLVIGRDSVARGMTLHHIGYVHLIPFHANGSDDSSQQLPGLTDKRSSLNIFLVSGRFTHKDKTSLLTSFAKDDRPPCFTQATALTVSQFLPDRFQVLGKCERPGKSFQTELLVIENIASEVTNQSQ
jgi:hypothetical protein